MDKQRKCEFDVLAVSFVVAYVQDFIRWWSWRKFWSRRLTRDKRQKELQKMPSWNWKLQVSGCQVKKVVDHMIKHLLTDLCQKHLSWSLIENMGSNVLQLKVDCAFSLHLCRHLHRKFHWCFGDASGSGITGPCIWCAKQGCCHPSGTRCRGAWCVLHPAEVVGDIRLLDTEPGVKVLISLTLLDSFVLQF